MLSLGVPCKIFVNILWAQSCPLPLTLIKIYQKSSGTFGLNWCPKLLISTADPSLGPVPLMLSQDQEKASTMNCLMYLLAYIWLVLENFRFKVCLLRFRFLIRRRKPQYVKGINFALIWYTERELEAILLNIVQEKVKISLDGALPHFRVYYSIVMI